jgi:hypothetical protein
MAVGSLADVQALVGPLAVMPRNPDDFQHGERLASYREAMGVNIRVLVEHRAGALVALSCDFRR